MVSTITAVYSPMPNWSARFSGSETCSGSGWETILIVKEAGFLRDLILKAATSSTGQMTVVASLDGADGDLDVISVFNITSTAIVKNAANFFAPYLLIQVDTAGTVTLDFAAR
jgi:hypothetical protein